MPPRTAAPVYVNNLQCVRLMAKPDYSFGLRRIRRNGKAKERAARNKCGEHKT